MPTEHIPNEAQIRDAMAQLKDSGQSSYGHSVQKYARLRLFDYKDLLDEWQNPAHPLPAQAQALPNVAAAINRPLNDEQGAKLAAYLRQQAHAGNSTAQLYLAYLHIFGRYLPTSLNQAALAIRHASEAGDWRASRLWAEMLLAAPQSAPDLLGHDTQRQALQWQQQHPEIGVSKIPPAIQRYYAAPTAVKMAAKQKLELAAAQGSPTAAKRLLGLTVLGEIPRHQSAPQFLNISNWLDVQLLRPKTPATDDPDIVLLPENTPLLLQPEDEDEKPIWWKPVLYGCVGLIAALVFVLILKILFRT